MSSHRRPPLTCRGPTARAPFEIEGYAIRRVRSPRASQRAAFAQSACLRTDDGSAGGDRERREQWGLRSLTTSKWTIETRECISPGQSRFNDRLSISEQPWDRSYVHARAGRRGGSAACVSWCACVRAFQLREEWPLVAPRAARGTWRPTERKTRTGCGIVQRSFSSLGAGSYSVRHS